MKKAITILMALLMLCSMVMCVSAAAYEGKGFIIDVPDGYYFDEGEEADGVITYFISTHDDNIQALELEIFVEESDDPKAQFEEYAGSDTVVTFAGRPAIIGYANDDNCSIITYTDNYFIGIDCEGDSEGAKAAYKIAETIKFTDVGADDTDNQDDTTTIGAIEENTPNTTVLIAVIAVAAVLIVAGVVIIVVFTKKKKNN